MESEYDAIKELGGEIVAVHREDKLEAKGLAKTRAAGELHFMLLSDLGNKATPRYSQKGFSTYVLDKDSWIRLMLERYLTPLHLLLGMHCLNLPQ